MEVASNQRFNDKQDGRHVGTRTPDLYRVNFEVANLKPFPHLAFPQSKGPKTTCKLPSFDGELMASFIAPQPGFRKVLRVGGEIVLSYARRRVESVSHDVTQEHHPSESKTTGGRQESVTTRNSRVAGIR